MCPHLSSCPGCQVMPRDEGTGYSYGSQAGRQGLHSSSISRTLPSPHGQWTSSHHFTCGSQLLCPHTKLLGKSRPSSGKGHLREFLLALTCRHGRCDSWISALRLMHQAPFSHCTGCSWYHPGFTASPPVGIQHSQFRTILSASTQHLELMVTLKSLAAQSGIYMGVGIALHAVSQSSRF